MEESSGQGLRDDSFVEELSFGILDLDSGAFASTNHG
jgi:hypothetical protein